MIASNGCDNELCTRCNAVPTRGSDMAAQDSGWVQDMLDGREPCSVRCLGWDVFETFPQDDCGEVETEYQIQCCEDCCPEVLTDNDVRGLPDAERVALFVALGQWAKRLGAPPTDPLEARRRVISDLFGGIDSLVGNLCRATEAQTAERVDAELGNALVRVDRLRGKLRELLNESLLKRIQTS